MINIPSVVLRCNLIEKSVRKTEPIAPTARHLANLYGRKWLSRFARRLSSTRMTPMIDVLQSRKTAIFVENGPQEDKLHGEANLTGRRKARR